MIKINHLTLLVLIGLERPGQELLRNMITQSMMADGYWINQYILSVLNICKSL